jgi:hypothetical protein
MGLYEHPIDIVVQNLLRRCPQQLGPDAPSMKVWANVETVQQKPPCAGRQVRSVRRLHGGHADHVVAPGNRDQQALMFKIEQTVSIGGQRQALDALGKFPGHHSGFDNTIYVIEILGPCEAGAKTLDGRSRS